MIYEVSGMNMRQILSRRNNKGARLALSILLTVSMLLGSVPNGALKAMAEELEQVPVEEVVPDAGEQATDGVAVAGETPAEDTGGEAAAEQGEEPQDGTVVADSQDSEQDSTAADDAADQTDIVAPLAAPAPGGPLGAPVTDTRPKVDCVDTADMGIIINLFNYDAVDINSQNTYAGTISYTGINANRDEDNQLHFFASGSNGNPVYQNNLNQFTGKAAGENRYNEQYANQGIVKANLLNGFPELNTNASDRTTNYLFDPNTQESARTDYLNVNKLFYLENEGSHDEMLTYDSNDAYAYYDVDQSDGGDFTVYQGTFERANSQASTDGMMVGFFPFDYPRDEWWNGTNPPEINATRANPPVDHHLGMTLEFPFDMPYNGQIHSDDGTDTDTDMVFHFSGDDDMWIFVDDKLVLDIGGIHQPVGGTINFRTGEVTLESGSKIVKVQDSYAYTATGINSPTAEDLKVRGDKVYLWGPNGIFGDSQFRAGTPHTLKAFYLERGGCDSNLRISTNIHLMTKKKVNVEKAWHPSVPDFNKTSSVEVELIRKAVGRDNTSHVECAVVSTATLDETGEWQASWSDLPSEGYNATGRYDEAAGATNTYCDYSYYVREVPVHGCYPEYSNSTSITAEEITYTDAGGDQKTAPAAAVGDNYEPMLITNMPQHTQVAVEKAWTDSATNDHASDSIWVQLYKTVDSVTTAVGSHVELKRDADAAKSWKHVFENLDVLPAGGTYTVAEGKVESGSFVSYGTDPFQLNGKTYKQKSIVYTDADDVTVDALDGTVKDNAGKAVITNEPIQANIIIKKVDAKDRTVNIPGATFKVYKDDGVTPVAYSAATDNVPAFANETVSTFTTGTDGTIRVDGLIPGVYWLVETDTADGYLVRDPNHPIQVVVGSDGLATYVKDTAYETDLSCPDLSTTKQDGAQTLTVPNVPVYALPSAGGTGAYPFLAAGAFVAAMALTSDDVKRRLMGLLGMGARR